MEIKSDNQCKIKDHLNILILADMHWGAIDPDEFTEQLKAGLFKYINELYRRNEELDYIFIAGDLFDTKETFSSLVVRNVINFMANLMYRTEGWGTFIYILEGTRTHDNLQLTNLAYAANSFYGYERINVIDRVTAIRTFEGDSSILLVPEEYIPDQDEYYGKYFADDCQYDIIIGHGMVDKIWYAKKDKDSQTTLTKHMSAPVFKVDDLLDHCKKCYFGHVHMNKTYGDSGRFAYIGPYTNWEFGKSTKVGFYHVKIDLNTREVTDTYIENTMAKNYPTTAVKIIENMSLTDLNDMIDTAIANVYAQVNNIGKLRVVVTLSQSVETWQAMKDFLISKLGDMPNVKFILQIEEKHVGDEYIDEDGELDESKVYLFDHSIEISKRIQTYIKNKSGRDISIETIEKYLKG